LTYMDLSGLNLTIVGVGLAALVLLVLILRFAHRPKRQEPPTGLGLEIKSSAVPTKPEALPTGAQSNPLAGAGSERFAPYAQAAGSVPVTKGSWEVGEPDVAESTDARGRASGSGDAVTPGGVHACPKCGGRFLHGEMEGPVLMIDGVAREDFQPLLSARECNDCGYLEFYTRAERV